MTIDEHGATSVAGEEVAVRYDVADGVATLTMDQPATRNALTPELMAGLASGLARAGAEPKARVVVLTHTGPAFCAGADLRSKDTPAGVVQASSADGSRAPDIASILTSIQDLRLPVVARIAGHCMGGGVGLAAACDISVAAEDVKLGFTEVRLGVTPAIISVVCLPKLRRADALELFLTGDRIPAARAAAVGLITRAVAADALDETVAALVASLKAGGPNALAVVKSLVFRVPDLDREEGFRWTSQLSGELFASDEGVEGRTAFRERRPPAWVDAAGS